MLFKDETEKILKACINVHNELGNCFLEPVYQEALSIEFDLLGIPYEKEVKLEISYKGHTLDKIYYADFVCFESIIVELKAVSKLINAHKAQLINYLNAINKEVGLLINFGEASLKWQRITNFKVKDVSPEQIRVE
ncbi:MAG: GxxExxY protein [Treponema sp.]|nr:GxxExxY protein [Treponema sp.]